MRETDRLDGEQSVSDTQNSHSSPRPPSLILALFLSYPCQTPLLPSSQNGCVTLNTPSPLPLRWPPPVSGTTYSLIVRLTSAMPGRRGVAEPGGHGWIVSGAGGR